MYLFLIALSVVALIALCPYIRCLVKRLTCAKKIKKICREKGYSLHPTHPLWFLGGKHAKKCDLYIETPNEVFAVKLFAMLRKHTILVFKDNGEYFVRSFVAFLSWGSPVRFPMDGKPKSLPPYDFRYQYQRPWEIKTPRRILLVNPVSMEFRRQPQHGRETVVGAGEIVNGMEIDSLPRLLENLENAL